MFIHIKYSIFSGNLIFLWKLDRNRKNKNITRNYFLNIKIKIRKNVYSYKILLIFSGYGTFCTFYIYIRQGQKNIYMCGTRGKIEKKYIWLTYLNVKHNMSSMYLSGWPG